MLQANIKLEEIRKGDIIEYRGGRYTVAENIASLNGVYTYECEEKWNGVDPIHVVIGEESLKKYFRIYRTGKSLLN